MYKIFMARGMHHYTVKMRRQRGSMIATPIVVVTARLGMYQFLECSKARQRGTEYVQVTATSTIA